MFLQSDARFSKESTQTVTWKSTLSCTLFQLQENFNVRIDFDIFGGESAKLLPLTKLLQEKQAFHCG